MLWGSDLSLSILACYAWYHRVLVVVILLPSNKVVLVQLLLNVGHITISFQSLSTFDLIFKLALVFLNGLILFISLILLKLGVEHADLIGLLRVVLACGLVNCLLQVLVLVHLLEQLLLVLLAYARLVILSHLGPLVHDLLIALHIDDSCLLFM